ncbi:MAG: radical SAM protein [Planctomycetota bacterium]|jgi:MoaA/NifB/PqqE/SkfB family radical SAM enzyme
MLQLQDNLFNARQSRHQPKLKLWRYAGLMLTYRCPAVCRFCYYCCGPEAGGLMSVDTAIRSWEGLVRIAGDTAKVHITGGEPFLYFDRLAEICQRAHRLGLTPVDSIETNAGVWNGPGELKDQLRVLDQLGLGRLKISWDAFHEEYLDIDRVRAFVSIARNVLGPQRVLVRWEKHLSHPTGIRQQKKKQKESTLLAALAADSCRFTGRAAEQLAPLAARFEPGIFRGRHCQNALLGSKGVHIDPYGNVFNGQCSGMVVGNVEQNPLDLLWKTFEPDRLEFWRTLYHDGPFGMAASAEQEGFRVRDHYASKCHFCTDIRRFFFDNKIYSTIITPCDCYGH